MNHNKQAMSDAAIVAIVLLILCLFLGQGVAVLTFIGF